MCYSKFKNDNRANPDLVIEHMLKEMEKTDLSYDRAKS